MHMHNQEKQRFRSKPEVLICQKVVSLSPFSPVGRFWCKCSSWRRTRLSADGFQGRFILALKPQQYLSFMQSLCVSCIFWTIVCGGAAVGPLEAKPTWLFLLFTPDDWCITCVRIVWKNTFSKEKIWSMNRGSQQRRCPVWNEILWYIRKKYDWPFLRAVNMICHYFFGRAKPCLLSSFFDW